MFLTDRTTMSHIHMKFSLSDFIKDACKNVNPNAILNANRRFTVAIGTGTHYGQGLAVSRNSFVTVAHVIPEGSIRSNISVNGKQCTVHNVTPYDENGVDDHLNLVTVSKAFLDFSSNHCGVDDSRDILFYASIAGDTIRMCDASEMTYNNGIVSLPLDASHGDSGSPVWAVFDRDCTVVRPFAITSSGIDNTRVGNIFIPLDFDKRKPARGDPHFVGPRNASN